jgi:hypothetical protein
MSGKGLRFDRHSGWRVIRLGKESSSTREELIAHGQSLVVRLVEQPEEHLGGKAVEIHGLSWVGGNGRWE